MFQLWIVLSYMIHFVNLFLQFTIILNECPVAFLRLPQIIWVSSHLMFQCFSFNFKIWLELIDLSSISLIETFNFSLRFWAQIFYFLVVLRLNMLQNHQICIRNQLQKQCNLRFERSLSLFWIFYIANDVLDWALGQGVELLNEIMEG